MDLALNNLQRLICHKNQTKPNQTVCLSIRMGLNYPLRLIYHFKKKPKLTILNSNKLYEISLQVPLSNTRD